MRTVLVALLGMGLMAGAATAAPLEPLQWKKRILLVFADADSAGWRAQREALAGDGAAERDLLVLNVPDRGAVSVEGVGRVEAAELRRAYGVAPDATFTALLVGKDGGVKERASQPIAADELFATIDAMPMRANEASRRR